MPVRKKLIRELVVGVLEKHKVRRGAVPVEKIAKEIGIEIALDRVDNDLSGFLFRDRQNGRTVIGANKNHHENRIRFTIAHELGHYFLHEGEVVHLDQETTGITMNFRDTKSAEGDDTSEREANLFAAELLMPEKFLREELEGKRVDLLAEGNVIDALAQKYQVSSQALTFRLTNLGYVKL